jgi:hypothetical protein
MNVFNSTDGRFPRTPKAYGRSGRRARDHSTGRIGCARIVYEPASRELLWMS